MVETLSQPVRLRLEQALAQWRHWQHGPVATPTVSGVLEGGRSNTSVKISSGQTSWVVRLDGINPTSLGISRSAEWRALNQAASHKLAPTPTYSNPELGVLVYEFCEADPAQDPGISEIEDIAGLLRAIHALPPVKFRLDPLTRARRYQHLAGTSELSESFLLACERLAEHVHTHVLCHNDLLRANRLRCNNSLLALDWEYAAMGDPLFDLAAVIEGDKLDEAQASLLLATWLEAQPTQQDQQRLEDNRLVYRELNELWECVYNKQF
jgi:aminoglycoside phosphotransferase (APT) family kinase protein